MRHFTPRWVLVLALFSTHAAPATATDDLRAPCPSRDELRRPFFGDLHVHTTLSLDASTQGTRLRPRDAYQFARGKEVGIQPHDEDGQALRRLRLGRPLDFAAVTDHAELFGELRTCRTPGLPGHDSAVCMVYRRWPRLAFFLMNSVMAEGAEANRFSFCGDNNIHCAQAAQPPWRETIDAAQEANDPCGFTSFVAYEWTGAPMSQNLHRNVIFANATVPRLPVSALDATIVSQLWNQLDEVCRSDQGCEWMAIPHNSNLSGGLMFGPQEETGKAFTPEYAEHRRRSEPLVEVVQHKGDSECREGLGTNDESCNFELLPYDTFAGKYSINLSEAPAAVNFVRNALKAGLVHEEKLGTNPFQSGMIGSTDTHLGTPGYVSERGHPGHGGAGQPASAGGPPRLTDDIEFNPGGLAVVWAEENTRASIFAALRRRETYSTSGPRMSVRFFGGWDYPAQLCDARDFVGRGYAKGVAMGAEMPAQPAPAARPHFAVSALSDPGSPTTPGASLQQIQIVKGWSEGGETHEKVYQVARGREEETIDPKSCAVPISGSRSLCAVWSDPDFDPKQRAFYYARVLENPTCRWHTHLCQAAGVDCTAPSDVPETLAACCDETYPATIQERALTSPIWYSPPPAA